MLPNKATDVEYSNLVDIPGSDVPQVAPAQSRPAQPEHGHGWPPAAQPPVNFCEWLAVRQRMMSDPHRRDAIQTFLAGLSPTQQKRIDLQLRSNFEKSHSRQ